MSSYRVQFGYSHNVGKTGFVSNWGRSEEFTLLADALLRFERKVRELRRLPRSAEWGVTCFRDGEKLYSAASKAKGEAR